MTLFKLLKPALILPVCLLTLAQCGLEYLPFLTAPVSLGPSLDTFSVRKTAANDSESALEWEYRGIELFYKFYVQGAVTDNNLTELSELTAKQFRRISSFPDDQVTSIQKPLIDGTALAGNVDFVIDMENKTITETSTPAVVIPDIRRGVPYGFSEIGYYPYYQRFLVDDFDAADADVGTSIYEITGIPASKITMVVYALSYGKKDYSVDLYSEAVYLGEIDVNFGW